MEAVETLLTVNISEKALVLEVVRVEALADCVSFEVGALATEGIELLTRDFRFLFSWAGGSILLGLICWFIDILFWHWRHLAHLITEVLKWLEAITFLFLTWEYFGHIVQSETCNIRWVLEYLVLFLIMETNIDILIEILGQLKHFLDSTSSTSFEVVVVVISLCGFLILEVIRSHSLIFEGFLHFR